MKMRLYFSTILVALFSSFTAMPPKEWLMLKTAEYSIQYPQNWKTDLSGLLGTRFILFSPKDSAGIRTYVNLSVQPESGDSISVDSLLSINKAQLPFSIENYQFVSSEIVKSNGIESFRLCYSGIQGKKQMKWIQQGFLYKKHYYTLIFTASEGNYNKFHTLGIEILNTLKIY